MGIEVDHYFVGAEGNHQGVDSAIVAELGGSIWVAARP